MTTVWVSPSGPVWYAEAPGSVHDQSGQVNTGPALVLQTEDGGRVVVEAGTREALLAYLDVLRHQVV